MHFLGYIITLANLQGLSNNTPHDISIRVASVQTISEELQRLPGFSIEEFRQTGYQRHGVIGIYLSKNVQNYLFYNQGQPEDEGLMLTMFFSEYPQDGDQVDGRQSLFVPRDSNIPPEIQNIISNYAQTGEWEGLRPRVIRG